MDIGKIEKKSKLYSVLRLYLKFVHDFIFYKRVVYEGIENIPDNHPVLLAPNHQNALMDPLAILFSQKHQTVFLARSDIFAKKIIAKFLFLFKVMPVYRIRDGKEKLKLNEYIFDKTVEILNNKKTLALFPEAQHIDKRHLRELKKGIQRVAFKAEEDNNYSLDVKIVPVGIYYSNYWNYRTVLHVKFGEAISVSDFYENNKENPQKAMLILGDKLSDKIKNLIIDIHDLENYQVYENLREIYDYKQLKEKGFKTKNQKEKFHVDKNTIEIVSNISANKSDVFENLKQKSNSYFDGLKIEKLRDWVFENKNSFVISLLNVVLLFLGFPVFIYGFLSNLIPFLFTKFVTKNIKDRQFLSSVNFVLLSFLFPIYHLISSLVLYLVTFNWYIFGGYLITSLFSGVFTYEYNICRIKIFSSLKYKLNSKKTKIKELIKLRNEIIEILDNNAIK